MKDADQIVIDALSGGTLGSTALREFISRIVAEINSALESADRPELEYDDDEVQIAVDSAFLAIENENDVSAALGVYRGFANAMGYLREESYTANISSDSDAEFEGMCDLHHNEGLRDAAKIALGILQEFLK